MLCSKEDGQLSWIGSKSRTVVAYFPDCCVDQTTCSFHIITLVICRCSSVSKSCLTLCDPVDYSTKASPSSTIFQHLLTFTSTESVMLWFEKKKKAKTLCQLNKATVGVVNTKSSPLNDGEVSCLFTQIISWHIIQWKRQSLVGPDWPIMKTHMFLSITGLFSWASCSAVMACLDVKCIPHRFVLILTVSGVTIAFW